MGNIYTQERETLHELLNRAGADGATVVIPDLQRPYVWQPDQVVLLIDSLIRGWPFGTLLMWKVKEQDLASIPHRQFWQIIDRTNEGDTQVITRKDPPAEFEMVLDGQQRLQSLLLALQGDGWGFKLEDRAWDSLAGERVRGRKPKYPHWTKGTLCFNLNAFEQEYQRCQDVTAVDYRRTLEWAVTDTATGRSTHPKPDNYATPLSDASTSQHRGNLIRFSRIWAAVSPDPNIKERGFREAIIPVLHSHGVDATVIERLELPLGELMSTLSEMKRTEIGFLQLRPLEDETKRDTYNEAIVNIFTRLNTAGKPLTREEITLAWLKVGWIPALTSNRTAEQCFSDLLKGVRESGLLLKMDELVRAVSFIWSVSYNGGHLLADKDLLNGDTVRPMANDLAASWRQITVAIMDVLQVAQDRDLKYGQNGPYNSLNALHVLWAWKFSAMRWVTLSQQAVMPRNDFDKQVSTLLGDNIDRWLLCSQWAGRWAVSSSRSVAGFVSDLNHDWMELESISIMDDAIAVLRHRLQTMIDDLVVDASDYVRQFAVDRRDLVSRYAPMLWIWHRLDDVRWQKSSIPLRIGRKKVDIEVDHAVAYSLWEDLVKRHITDDKDAQQGFLDAANLLGNCMLLEKSFNISKSKQPLSDFLPKIHEFKQGIEVPEEWSEALNISEAMLNPDVATVESVAKAISIRDESMRSEIIEFIRGERRRADVT